VSLTREQIQARMVELQLESSSMRERQIGLLSLFNSACVMNAQKEMQELRDALHVNLDASLDNCAMQFLLSRQLIGMGGA
jgi:hypothetical protein